MPLDQAGIVRGGDIVNRAPVLRDPAIGPLPAAHLATVGMLVVTHWRIIQDCGTPVGRPTNPNRRAVRRASGVSEVSDRAQIS